MVLGLLIAVGNALLAGVIDRVTFWAGYRLKDRRDVAVLGMAFLGTLLNTCFDLVMVAHIAKGVSLNQAFAGETAGYDTAVASQLYQLIVPGYLFVPYWLGVWLIRSHIRIRERHAHSAMRCPDFDI